MKCFNPHTLVIFTALTKTVNSNIGVMLVIRMKNGIHLHIGSAVFGYQVNKMNHPPETYIKEITE